MAGFKQSVLDHQPKLFLTFDGDFADQYTGYLIDNPDRIIIDESGEENHGTMIVDHDTVFSYRLKAPTLIETEILDNFSCGFGIGVPYPESLHPSRWAQSFIHIPHSSSFNFMKNNGSYSVGFMFKREENDRLYREIEEATGDLVRPLIRKGLMLEINTVDRRGPFVSDGGLEFNYITGNDGLTQEKFTLSMTFASDEQDLSYYLGGTPGSDYNFLVVTWDVKPSSTALWEGTLKIYLNGIVVHTFSKQYFDQYPNTNVSSPWEIGGAATDPGDNLLDRQVAPTFLDQIFVLDKALSDDDVNTLFRKTRSYKRIIKTQRANNFWALDDENLAGYDVIYNEIRPTAYATDSNYFGSLTNQVLRSFTGPDKIPNSKSVMFRDGGSGRVKLNGGTESFTIDGWFNTSFTKRGVIISTCAQTNPWRGVTLEINKRENNYDFGRIQLSLTEDIIINSKLYKEDNVNPLYFNDDNWHYFCITKNSDNMVELWLDGIKHGEAFVGEGDVLDTYCHLMSSPPSDLYTDGLLSNIATYNYQLSDAQKRIRYSYGVTWRIRGTCTLQGVPHEATVRVLRHSTGEHLQDVKSDSNDGTYMITLFDNSLVDLVVFDNDDINVRHRSFGPITPTVHDDNDS